MKIKYSRVTVPPAVEPIDTTTAILDLKLDDDHGETNLLTIWIQAAREIVEARTGRSLITQTREIKFDSFPCHDSIYLTSGPVQSVTSVEYFDQDGNEQTLPVEDYWVDTHSDIARIVIKESWPQVDIKRPNSVTVTCVCGYGDAAADVPGALRSAVMLFLAHLYKNREEGADTDSSAATIDETPFGAELLMRPFVVEYDVIQ